MRSKTPIVLLSLVLSSLLTILVMKLGGHARAPSSNSDAPGSAPVTGEDDDNVRSSVTGHHPRSVSQPRPPLPALPAAPAAASATPNPAQAKTPEEFSREVEEAFAADSPADARSSEMQAGIAEAFRKPAAAGAVLRGVDCHRTRCRLTVDMTDEAADRRVFSDIFTLLASAGVDTDKLGFVVPTRTVREDGSVAAVVHLYHVPNTI